MTGPNTVSFRLTIRNVNHSIVSFSVLPGGCFRLTIRNVNESNNLLAIQKLIVLD
mgnify:CR=1 FL=1